MPALNTAALTAVDETQCDQGVDPGGTKTLRTIQLQHSPTFDSDGGCNSSSPSGAGKQRNSRDNTPDHNQALGFDVLLSEIQELRAIQGLLKERLEKLKLYRQQRYTQIVEALQEKQYKCERLEEELSDFTELYQNEILNLKEELTSMEEIIVYQSHTETADLHEALEVCRTRLFKIEQLQQQQQQQQVVRLEGLENFTAQVLLEELINALLAVTMVLLVFVSTMANCVSVMKTPGRALSTLLFLVLLILLWGQWDAISDHLHFSILHSKP